MKAKFISKSSSSFMKPEHHLLLQRVGGKRKLDGDADDIAVGTVEIIAEEDAAKWTCEIEDVIEDEGIDGEDLEDDEIFGRFARS